MSRVLLSCLPRYESANVQGASSGNGEVPLMLLASYAKFSFAEAEGRTAAIMAIDAIAVAAAHCMPVVPLAGALSSTPGAPDCWVVLKSRLAQATKPAQQSQILLLPSHCSVSILDDVRLLSLSPDPACGKTQCLLAGYSVQWVCSMSAGRQMDGDLQKALQEPFKPEAALADPQRAIAAAQLLGTAAVSHPSLLVALMYPTSLSVSVSADGSTPQTSPAPPTSSSQVG